MIFLRSPGAKTEKKQKSFFEQKIAKITKSTVFKSIGFATGGYRADPKTGADLKKHCSSAQLTAPRSLEFHQRLPSATLDLGIIFL